MEKQKIGVKASLNYKEVVAYLKDFVKSLESGKIVLESGGEHVTLIPTDNVHVKIEAKTKKDKQKLSFEISWCEPAQADLKITDAEPAPAPAGDVALAGTETMTEAPAVSEEKEGKDDKKDKKKDKKVNDSKENKDKSKPGKKKK